MSLVYYGRTINMVLEGFYLILVFFQVFCGFSSKLSRVAECESKVVKCVFFRKKCGFFTFLVFFGNQFLSDFWPFF